MPIQAETKELKVQQSWDGIIGDDKLLKDALPIEKPHQGTAVFVADKQAWAKLWKVWRGNQKLPGVDFTKTLVLVFTLGGPNLISLTELRLDDKGELKAEASATLKPGMDSATRS